MAKSGQYISSKYSKAYSMIFDWAVVSQDVESNSSTINWTLTFKANGSAGASSDCSTDFPDTINVYVDDNTYTTKLTENWSVAGGQSKILASGSTVVYHQSFEAQTFTYSFSTAWELTVATTVNFGWEIGVQSDVIDYIVRSAYITSYPTNWTDEDSPTITYSNPAGNYATQLQACISFAGEDDIAYRDIPKTGTSYTFNLTDAEKAILWEKLYSDSYTSRMYFYVRSSVPVLDGSTYETVLDKKLTTVQLINYTPIMIPTVVEGDSNVDKLTGGTSFVAGMSDGVFNLSSAARKGATIVNQYATNGYKQINAATGTFTDVTSNTFYFYVEDSRGNITRESKVVNWIPYVKPTVKIKSADLTSSGQLILNISGKYFNGSFGGSTNKLAIDVTVYEGNSETGSKYVDYLSPSVDTENNYTATHTLSGLSYDKRYRYVVKVFDELATSAETSGITAAEPLFDWGKEDFRFNIPVTVENNLTVTGDIIINGVSLLQILREGGLIT